MESIEVPHAPQPDLRTDAVRLSRILDLVGPVAVMSSVRDDRGTIVDFRYDLVNPAFCRAVRESEDVLLGRCLLELFPSHRRLGLFDAYRRVVETGEEYLGELPWFDERNVHAYFEVSVARLDDGYVMTGRDVTAAKLGEQVREIFEASGDSLVSVDRELRVHPGAEGAGSDAPRPGDPVEVWSAYTRSWIPGFFVLDEHPDGTLIVRRASDGVTLPRPMAPGAVRSARHPSQP